MAAAFNISSPEQNTGAAPVLVVAGTDFQLPETSLAFYGKTDYIKQIQLVEKIAGNINKAYPDAGYYGFFADGDYNFDEIKGRKTDTENGIKAVKTAINNVFKDKNVNMIFVQGNHDSLEAEGLAMSGSKGYDTEHYGVFVMNENEYRSYPLTGRKWFDWQQSERVAKELADELDAYLSQKAAADYDKPVFILSHVPFHFSTRTVAKADGIYADDFVTVLNRYGVKLNIFFLYGHNHAWGDDDYLGGGSVFLTRGDKIEIAKHGSTSADDKYEVTLKFTYMSCGYMGYLWDQWSGSYDLAATGESNAPVQNPDADNTLTMTSFCIEGNTVTVARWDEDGMHVLKAKGASSLGKRNDCDHEVCAVNSKVINSPQTVTPVNG